MSAGIYRITFPGQPEDVFTWIEEQRYLTQTRTGKALVISPEVRQLSGIFEVRFVRIWVHPGDGAQLVAMTDPDAARAVRALLDIAWKTFPFEPSKKMIHSPEGLGFKKLRFREVREPDRWRVFTCLSWKRWQEAGIGWKERAAQVEEETRRKVSPGTLYKDCQRMRLVD